MIFPDVEAVIVAYSGGKDSLALLDICLRAGKRVEALFMHFLPGLDYTRHWIEFAERRFQIKVRSYQHWGLSYYLRRGVFRSEPDQTVPVVNILDLEAAVRQDTGLDWIGYGYKSIDSLQRRGMMNRWPGGINEKRHSFAPLKGWSNGDVMAYLSRRGLPSCSIDGKRVSGISLTPESLEYMRREWLADYRRILEVFPLAIAQADRAQGIREKRQRGITEKRNKTRAARRHQASAGADHPALADQPGAL